MKNETDHPMTTQAESLRAALRSVLDVMESDPCDCMAHRSGPEIVRAALAATPPTEGLDRKVLARHHRQMMRTAKTCEACLP